MSRQWDFNWQRISRGCVLGAIVMLCWLAAPIVACSWDAWNATPISSMDPAAGLSQADQQRVDQSKGFFDKLGSSVKQCWAKTPLLDQEPWKTNLLYTFAGVAVLAFGLHRWQNRRTNTYSK